MQRPCEVCESLAKVAAPTEPPKPQMPTMEPTARRGYISDTIVKMLAAQP